MPTRLRRRLADIAHRAPLALLLAATLSSTSACAAPSGPRVILESGGKSHRVQVELADTEAKRERGLMFRKELPDGHGMLFLFDEEGEHSFWMKDTLIPLDMIFVDSAGRVTGIVARARPLTLEQLPGHHRAEARGHHALHRLLELAAPLGVAPVELDAHARLVAVGPVPDHDSLELEGNRSPRDHQPEPEGGAEWEGAPGRDERAALGDVLRVVGEERVQLLVDDLQLHGLPGMLAAFLGHRRMVARGSP